MTMTTFTPPERLIDISLRFVTRDADVGRSAVIAVEKIDKLLALPAVRAPYGEPSGDVLQVPHKRKLCALGRQTHPITAFTLDCSRR
jgi:hypothetical protein